jgi:tRNA-specific 2-thiouridylase
VRLRAHGQEAGCQVVPLGDGREGSGRIRLDLDEPVGAVAPGQAAVLYEDDLVLGGGTVAATAPAVPAPGG